MTQEHSWYAKQIPEVFELLRTHERGLANDEAKQRLASYGPNKLPEGKVESALTIFVRQFRSPLIYLLLVAGGVIYFTGDTADAAIIFAVLVFNAIIGAFQEGKAQNTLRALQSFAETRATVIREDEEILVPDYEVVPGDIIVLHEGERVPADARMVATTHLAVDEAALTGESEPVLKQVHPYEQPHLEVTEQKNMVFKGTYVLAGNGTAVVTATGQVTVIGAISKEIATADAEIPLKVNIRYLSRLIIYVVAAISVFLFIAGLASGESASTMFATVVTLAVSIIPEGLPIVMTLVLATGVRRMSKRNALVKKLQAVEALGQARVIAVDKTGTITKNEMVIQKVYLAGKTFDIGGVGYEPKGDVLIGDNTIDPANHPELLFAGTLAAFCANARVFYSETDRLWRVAGDPTEAAMLVFAEKIGFHKTDLERESPLVGEMPFNYQHKYHATVHRHRGKNLLTVIGAPEVILEHALPGDKHAAYESQIHALSATGLRVVAVATAEIGSETPTREDVSALTIIGLFGMKDALREGVAEATQRAMEAGMRVVMMTGDHMATAQTIAREAGIYRPGDETLTGRDIETLSDEELKGKMARTTVFARVLPEHKLRIIEMYRARGEIVAMTGDGVNDAPSLVAADLGVSMGKIGTEVAKEASDIVLLDDNFGSIVSAIEEGRSIYKTIKKVILYLFSTSWGETLTISGAVLLGYPIPLLPAQIIWLNFVTDGFLDVALSMEPKEKGLLRGTFEHPKKYLVDKLMVQRMFSMAIPMTVGTLVLFSSFIADDLTKAWTISLTTLAVFQWFNVWNCRHESISLFRTNPFSNPFLVGATLLVISLHLLVIYNPTMQTIMHTTPLSAAEWLLIIPTAASIILVEEIRKFLYRTYTIYGKRI